MSEKGVLSKSIANNISEAIIDKLGGTGYAPTEWSKNINLLGISSADIEEALASITEDTSSSDKGLLSLPIASDMGAILNKKYNTSRGFKPSEVSSAVSALIPLPEKTTSSDPIADFSDGADDVPTKSLVVTIPPMLSGVSSVSETQTGRNLLNDSIRGASGANIFFGHDTGIQNDFSVRLRAGTYTFSVVTADGTITNLYVRNSDTNTNITGFPAYGVLSKTFTLTKDTNCAVFAYKSGYTDVTDILTAQIEFGSTAHAYEPYTTPTTYTASLGRTIYGGTADIVNGTGTEGYNKITLSSLLTDLNITQIGTTGVYLIRFSLADAKGAINSAVFNGLCDYYTPITANQTYAQNEGISINTSGQCYIYDSRFNASTSLNDFKTWIDANPVNLCYELATPTDFTFTGQEIPTRLGYNAFWSDSGDTEVTYRADIDLYEEPSALSDTNNTETEGNEEQEVNE